MPESTEILHSMVTSFSYLVEITIERAPLLQLKKIPFTFFCTLSITYLCVVARKEFLRCCGCFFRCFFGLWLPAGVIQKWDYSSLKLSPSLIKLSRRSLFRLTTSGPRSKSVIPPRCLLSHRFFNLSLRLLKNQYNPSLLQHSKSSTGKGLIVFSSLLLGTKAIGRSYTHRNKPLK